MTDSARTQSVTLTWRRSLSDEQLRVRRWVILTSSVILLLSAALAFALSAPSMGVFFVVWASISIPLLWPRRCRIRTTSEGIELRRQQVYANTWLWFTLTAVVSALGALCQIVVGDPQAWRLILPCVGSVFVGFYFAHMAFRLRGPLRISAHEVSDQVGHRIMLKGSQIEAVPPERGGPMVRILPVEISFPSASGFLIPPRELGLDFNTVVSTLQQLVDWSATGREATPAEIAAMITAVGPASVGVGESADVVVNVAEVSASK